MEKPELKKRMSYRKSILNIIDTEGKPYVGDCQHNWIEEGLYGWAPTSNRKKWRCSKCMSVIYTDN